MYCTATLKSKCVRLIALLLLIGLGAPVAKARALSRKGSPRPKG